MDPIAFGSRKTSQKRNFTQGVKMIITVAGNKKEYKDGLTVAELIEAEKIDNPLYVTVSVNEEFVENGTFESTTLKDGDTVEFLYFMGGGC